MDWRSLSAVCRAEYGLLMLGGLGCAMAAPERVCVLSSLSGAELLIRFLIRSTRLCLSCRVARRNGGRR